MTKIGFNSVENMQFDSQSRNRSRHYAPGVFGSINAYAQLLLSNFRVLSVPSLPVSSREECQSFRNEPAGVLLLENDLAADHGENWLGPQFTRSEFKLLLSPMSS